MQREWHLDQSPFPLAFQQMVTRRGAWWHLSLSLLPPETLKVPCTILTSSFTATQKRQFPLSNHITRSSTAMLQVIVSLAEVGGCVWRKEMDLLHAAPNLFRGGCLESKLSIKLQRLFNTNRWCFFSKFPCENKYDIIYSKWSFGSIFIEKKCLFKLVFL